MSPVRHVDISRDNGLALQVVRNAVLATLAPKARLLYAPKTVIDVSQHICLLLKSIWRFLRCGGVGHDARVDGNHPKVQQFRDTMGSCDILGVDVGCQSDITGVCGVNSFVFSRKPQYRRNGTKNLLLEEAHVAGDICQYCRLVESRACKMRSVDMCTLKTWTMRRDQPISCLLLPPTAILAPF